MKRYLGIDIGSVSFKAALIDEGGGVLFNRWTRVAGDPIGAFELVMSEIGNEFGNITISGVCATGSGRKLLSDLKGAHLVNEISAHAAAAGKLMPDIRTIIEIGGQDSKLIILGKRSEVRDFSMNELCAAGTGAFLDQQSARLGLSIEKFAELARLSTSPVNIAGRCAVFAKTDMTHHQQEGRPLPDIVAGLNLALARSYCSNMVRGRELPRPVAFQGGVASNEGLAAALCEVLGLARNELIVPEYHRVMGAMGAGLTSIAGCRMSVTIDDIAGYINGLKSRNTTANGKTGMRLTAQATKIAGLDISRLKLDGQYLGIDVGSVSVKLAVLSQGGMVFSDYRFSEGKPLETLRAMLHDLSQSGIAKDIKGAGVTGSGRYFVGRLMNADVIQNEITAQAKAAFVIMPSADTIVEIGGQDAKFMRVKGGRPAHFAMNKVCSAGTGAFLQEQATRLNVAIEGEFERLALESASSACLGTRCTVFMESDLVSHQQQGCSKGELTAGLARSVVANYSEKIVAGHLAGKEILFLGGVAKNRAVVAALCEEFGADVTTSSVGEVSGAIGAAIAAFEARRAGEFNESAFSFEACDIEVERTFCNDCPNNCAVTRTIEERPRTFGGRCGKWDKRSDDRRQRTEKYSYLKERMGLLTSVIANPRFKHSRAGSTKQSRKNTFGGLLRDKTPRNDIKVGIPRALLAFDKLPLWRTYFEGMGFEVVVSPPTDDAILAEGLKKLVVETCLPVKAFCAHLHWLEANGKVNFIFVPSYIMMGKDSHGHHTVHCPYIQSAVQFARPVTKAPLLTPAINWQWHPDDERKMLLKIACELGVKRDASRRALERAFKAEADFRSAIRELGTGVLEKLANKGIPRAFVVMGKDYNVYDERLNSSAVKILEDMGEVVITQDMLTDDSANYPRAYRTMYWSHGKEILAAAQIASSTPELYPVLITSFACGPDSFTIQYAKDILGQKPLLILEVDEHSSPVGMETRIEAFLDSLKKAQKATARTQRAHQPSLKDIETVYLPNFSDHSFAFASAMKALGFTPVPTGLPDDESARIGAKNVSSGECHPYVLMLGDFLKVARSCPDPSRSCYYMPESGACRVGQFGTQMRLAAEREGLGLKVVTRIEDIVSEGKTARTKYIKALLVYWEMMRGMDFLIQLYLSTRAYEVTAGETDAVYNLARKDLFEKLMAGRASEGLDLALARLRTVRTDRRRERVKIGITGDYYTRVCDYANSGIFREIEKLGGEVWIPPTMSDFVKYNAHQKTLQAFNHKHAGEFFQALTLRGLVNKRESKIRELFGDSLTYDVPLEYKSNMDVIKRYMDPKLPAGLTGSIASVMEQIRAGADGILNLITFHCTYGLVLSSVLKTINGDFPDIPKLTLIFEGLKPTHNFLRLEAFMERVKAMA